MTQTRRTVGLVGCGRWGSLILRDLLALGVDVAVLARSEETVARATQLGAARAATEAAVLEGCAGVVVATPTSTHARVVESVLALEVPVFVEKPLTCDEQDAARIVDRAPDRVFVMDKWRYHPGVAALARIARSGELGAVQGLRTVRVQSAAVHTDVDCTWTLAPHDLSIALEVLGVVPTPVAAVGHVEAGWPSGLIGLLRDGEGPWLTVDIASNAPAHVRRIELHCTGGVATLGDGWDEHVTITEATAEDGATRTVRVVPAAGELPLAAELRAFVDHLAGGPPPRSSALEGLRAVETIAELRRLAGFAG